MAKQALKKISKLPGAAPTLRDSPLKPGFNQAKRIGTALKKISDAEAKFNRDRTVAPFQAGKGDRMYTFPRAPSEATTWYKKAWEQTAERSTNKIRKVKSK